MNFCVNNEPTWSSALLLARSIAPCLTTVRKWCVTVENDVRLKKYWKIRINSLLSYTRWIDTDERLRGQPTAIPYVTWGDTGSQKWRRRALPRVYPESWSICTFSSHYTPTASQHWLWYTIHNNRLSSCIIGLLLSKYTYLYVNYFCLSCIGLHAGGSSATQRRPSVVWARGLCSLYVLIFVRLVR